MPVVVAQRHNPILKEFCDRLRQKGKHPMAIAKGSINMKFDGLFNTIDDRQGINIDSNVI